MLVQHDLEFVWLRRVLYLVLLSSWGRQAGLHRNTRGRRHLREGGPGRAAEGYAAHHRQTTKTYPLTAVESKTGGVVEIKRVATVFILLHLEHIFF